MANLNDLLKKRQAPTQPQQQEEQIADEIVKVEKTDYDIFIEQARSSIQYTGGLNYPQILQKLYFEQQEMPIVHKIHEWIKNPEMAQKELGLESKDISSLVQVLKNLRDNTITPCHVDPLACNREKDSSKGWFINNPYNGEMDIKPIYMNPSRMCDLIGTETPPEKIFDSLYCYYDKNAEPHQVPTFDENFKDCNQPVQSRWHIACIRHPEAFENFYAAADTYWKNLVKENLDQNGKINEKVVEELVEQATEFIYEMDYMLARTAELSNTVLHEIKHHYSHLSRQDYMRNVLAGLEKDSITIDLLQKAEREQPHEFAGITQIAERQQELENNPAYQQAQTATRQQQPAPQPKAKDNAEEFAR